MRGIIILAVLGLIAYFFLFRRQVSVVATSSRLTSGGNANQANGGANSASATIAAIAPGVLKLVDDVFNNAVDNTPPDTGTDTI